MLRPWELTTKARRLLASAFRAHRQAAVAAAPKRVTFVQYGDFSEGYQRLIVDHGPENYYAQRYTVEAVARIAEAPEIDAISVIDFASDHAVKQLAPKLFAGGVELYREGERPRYRALCDAIDHTRPTDVILCTPSSPILRHVLAQGMHLLPLFADSFRASGWRRRARFAELAWTLNDPRITWVANHNLAAALDLERIGVSRNKIVPFDWPALISPRARAPKMAPPCDRPFALIYVGQISEEKGVGDLIRATGALAREGFEARVTVVGSGDDLSPIARTFGIERLVSFVGKRSHSEVQDLMWSHDAVVVPSRHAYPEGLPMTLYEGLCSRSPLVTSDHPMFALRIKDRQNALVFRAMQPDELAASIRALATDAALYERLSVAAEQAADQYFCPLKWDRLITSWLGLAEDEIGAYALSTMPE